jgi:hypothetical protein
MSLLGLLIGCHIDPFGHLKFSGTVFVHQKIVRLNLVVLWHTNDCYRIAIGTSCTDHESETSKVENMVICIEASWSVTPRLFRHG